MAYGGSQARGLIGAVATGLHQSYSNTGSEPCLQPIPHLTVTPHLLPTEQGQGSNLQPHCSWSDSLTTEPRWERGGAPKGLYYYFFNLFFVSLLFLWAASAAYGGSQARGPIGAVATSLRQSHSNSGSEPHLQPKPQLTATLHR